MWSFYSVLQQLFYIKICTIFLRLVVDKLIILIVPAIKLTNLSANLL